MEYVIWGVARPQGGEQLLLSSIKNKPITSEKEANRLADLLEKEYNCTKVRIQKIDLTNGFNESFTKTVNQL